MAVCGKLGSALVYIFLKKINFCQNSCAYSRAFILQGFLETTGKIISLDNFGIFWCKSGGGDFLSIESFKWWQNSKVHSLKNTQLTRDLMLSADKWFSVFKEF